MGGMCTSVQDPKIKLTDPDGKSAEIVLTQQQKNVVKKVMSLKQGSKAKRDTYDQLKKDGKDTTTALEESNAARKEFLDYMTSDDYKKVKAIIDAKIDKAGLKIDKSKTVNEVHAQCDVSAHISDYDYVGLYEYDAEESQFSPYYHPYIGHAHDHYHYQHPQQYLYQHDSGYDLSSLALAIPSILIGLCLLGIIACICCICGGTVVYGATKLGKEKEGRYGYKKVVSHDRRRVDQYDEVNIFIHMSIFI